MQYFFFQKTCALELWNSQTKPVSRVPSGHVARAQGSDSSAPLRALRLHLLGGSCTDPGAGCVPVKRDRSKLFVASFVCTRPLLTNICTRPWPAVFVKCASWRLSWPCSILTPRTGDLQEPGGQNPLPKLLVAHADMNHRVISPAKLRR